MAAHSRQNVMAILPGGGGEHQVGFGVDISEDIHAHPLAGNEAVPAAGIDGKGASHGNACVLETLGQLALQILLGSPADLIGRKSQVTAGDQNDVFDGRICARSWHKKMNLIPFPQFRREGIGIHAQATGYSLSPDV